MRHFQHPKPRIWGAIRPFIYWVRKPTVEDWGRAECLCWRGVRQRSSGDRDIYRSHWCPPTQEDGEWRTGQPVSILAEQLPRQLLCRDPNRPYLADRRRGGGISIWSLERLDALQETGWLSAGRRPVLQGKGGHRGRAVKMEGRSRGRVGTRAPPHVPPGRLSVRRLSPPIRDVIRIGVIRRRGPDIAGDGGGGRATPTNKKHRGHPIHTRDPDKTKMFTGIP